jgi:hypothetical protein
VTKLCLALEAFRRTDEGRIRDAKAFLAHFFPQDKSGATDRIFYHLPNEVRADLLSNWGIRGKKSALRDDNDRVRNTVNDALNAGDIDATVIEEGITPEILTDWVPLEDWWLFWRGSNLPLGSVRKALALARELSLFDERWFLEHLALKSPKLDGTDVICAALSKEQLVAWMQAIHASGDASPSGMVAALGWEMILAKTAHEALLFALDALARQIGLAEQGPADAKPEPTTSETATLSEASPRATSEPPPEPVPEPPPTPKLEVPARVSSEPPEPITPEPPSAVTAVPPAETAPPPPPPLSAPLPRPSVPPPKHPSVKPPVPVSAKSADSTGSKPPPVPNKPPPPVPTSPANAHKPPPVPNKPPPPPVPAAASKQPPPVPASKPPARSITPVQADLPSVIIEEDPFFPAPPAASQVPLQSPGSTPPNARALFLGAVAEPPPMRPPMATLSGVAPQAVYGGIATDDVAVPTFTMPPSDPTWAPARAEPGDMGWDLVHGVTRPMGTNVAPRYNFEDDDEPTSEIELPRDMRRPRSQ